MAIVNRWDKFVDGKQSLANLIRSYPSFVQFYPYLPHFVDLSIDIVSGMRLQPGAPKHIGGSNRTIIKQAYEMLVSDRTALADAEVGALVSLAHLDCVPFSITL